MSDVVCGGKTAPTHSHQKIVAAALGVVGVRYRLHGRAPAFGLDCVGLAAIAMRAGGHTGEIPVGYAMRGGDGAAIAGLIEAHGLSPTMRPEPGDLLLFAAGPAQFHLAVMVPGGIVHADAMLRRVVERPGVAPWPLVAAWRGGR